MNLIQKQRRTPTLLGLALEGRRVEGVWLRRTNGSAEVQKSFVVTLSVDPLRDDAELVGRDLRKQLDAAGVRERRCAVALPTSWALSLPTALPDLPEADLASFLEIEAEKGFPYPPDSLMTVVSRWRSGEEAHALQVAIQRDHVSRLENVLRAARLVPVGFSLGAAALQPSVAEGGDGADGVIALVIGEGDIGLQVTAGGGVVALRSLPGTLEDAVGGRTVLPEVVARELRITLGQLPVAVRQSLRRVRVFGDAELARRLVEGLRPRADALGLALEVVAAYGEGELGVKLPAGTAVSAAASLAARRLAGRPVVFEFLPPRVSLWKQMAERYASRKLAPVGAVAGGVLVLVLLAFGVQQFQLSRLESRWRAMGPRVREVEALQQQIRRFRPWFDETLPSLSVMRTLTQAFPEDGSVSAKTLDIREPAVVTCTGVARDQQALMQTLDRLRGFPQVAKLAVEQLQGGRPTQFTFNFTWGEGGGGEN